MSKQIPSSGLPPVSDSELRVLEELWRHHDLSATQLRKVLADDGIDWAFTTIQTFLHRMYDKGYVQRQRLGRSWRYSASFPREEVFRQLAAGLAERFGNMESSSMVLGLLGDRDLKRKEIEHLRQVLDEAEARLQAGGEGPSS